MLGVCREPFPAPFDRFCMLLQVVPRNITRPVRRVQPPEDVDPGLAGLQASSSDHWLHMEVGRLTLTFFYKCCFCEYHLSIVAVEHACEVSCAASWNSSTSTHRHMCLMAPHIGHACFLTLTDPRCGSHYMLAGAQTGFDPEVLGEQGILSHCEEPVRAFASHPDALSTILLQSSVNPSTP